MSQGAGGSGGGGISNSILKNSHYNSSRNSSSASNNAQSSSSSASNASSNANTSNYQTSNNVPNAAGGTPNNTNGDSDDNIYFPYCDDVNKYEKIGKIGQGMQLQLGAESRNFIIILYILQALLAKYLKLAI